MDTWNRGKEVKGREGRKDKHGAGRRREEMTVAAADPNFHKLIAHPFLSLYDRSEGRRICAGSTPQDPADNMRK